MVIMFFLFIARLFLLNPLLIFCHSIFRINLLFFASLQISE